MEREYESNKQKITEPTGKYARMKVAKELDNHVSERERKKAHFLSSLNKKPQQEMKQDIPKQSIKKKVKEFERGKGSYLKRAVLEDGVSKGKYVNRIITAQETPSEESEDEEVMDPFKESAITGVKRVVVSGHSVYVKKVSKDRQKEPKQRVNNDSYKIQNEKIVMNKFRREKSESKNLSLFIEETKQQIIRVVARLKEIFSAKRSIYLIVAAIFLSLVILISALFTTCVSIADGVGIYILGLTMTEDLNMTESESYFAEKEMLLQERIDNITKDYPDYDEYVFDVDEIGHDPFLLMAYLSSAYKGYTLLQIKGVLDTIFDSLYQLTLVEQTEERTKWVYDEELAEWVEETYEVLVLYITLEKNDLETILGNMLITEDEKEMFDVYKDTGGAHQSFQNPFPIEWSDYVSSAFGWRIHPISGMEKFHNGIDIALQEGTPVGSCSKGIVILSYYSESAGNYVVVEDESGYRCHYMHLDERNVHEGDKVDYGDVIGTVGNTGNSTGPHLHLGVQDENKDWINPVFVVSDHVK